MAQTITQSKQHVKNIFSERAAEWAAGYADPEQQTLSAKTLSSRQRLALEMLEAAVPAPSRILDAGCGSGDMAAKLMQRGYEVWGVDIAEPMIRHARTLCGTDRFRVGDIEHIPFPDGTFDAVLSLGVIEYLDSDEQAVSEFRRVLKAGGTAIIATPSAISPLQRLDRALFRVMNAARPAYHCLKYGLRGKRPPSSDPSSEVAHRRYRRRNWLRLLRSRGLQPQEWICHGWGWYRSPVGFLAQFLSEKGRLLRRVLERFIEPASLSKAGGRFVRSRALNWLASEQIVRARAA